MKQEDVDLNELVAELKEARVILRRIRMITSKHNTDTNDLFKTVTLVNCTVNDYFKTGG